MFILSYFNFNIYIIILLHIDSSQLKVILYLISHLLADLIAKNVY